MRAQDHPLAVDRTSRTVARLRVRAHDTTVRLRVQSAVEEALRLTTLPGEDQGRLYVFRRLRLPAIGTRDVSSRAWLARCASHLLAVGRDAVHAADPRAAAADTVFFSSPQEPWRDLAIQLLDGFGADDWFWPEVTAVPRHLPPAIRLAQVLEQWVAQSGDWSIVARELLPALHVERARTCVALLPRDSVERWIAQFTRHGTSADSSRAPEVRERTARLLEAMRRSVSDGDSRLVFLAMLAVLEAAPATPHDADVPRNAVRLLQQPSIGRGKPAADATQHRGASDGDNAVKALPERQPAVSTSIAGEADPARRTSPIEAESWVSPERRTPCAGLYYVLQPLRRLGVAEWLREHPQTGREHFVARVLLNLSLRAGVADDDPILDALFEDLDVRAEARGLVRASTCTGAEELWARAIRMWCWRNAKMTLGGIVTRPGRVLTTATSIDVTMPLAAVDVRIRRCGLDIDPGYVPWFGRVVHFHYQVEE